MHKISLDGNSLNPEQAMAVSFGNAKASLSDASRDAMEASRRVIEDIIDSDDVVYGINTGFGALSSVRIERSELEELQANLVRSHACGVGNPMRPEYVLLMMMYRANSLAKGVSGARPEIVDLILAMVNQGIAPVVPRIGSLGASGDLAPLSHMTMGMMGEGDCMKRTDSGWVKMSSADALSSSGLTPVILEAKEGLSLINGTSQMCAYLTVSLLNLEMLTMVADACVACSVEAIKGSHSPFDYRIHASRPQHGQSVSAARISGLLLESQILQSHIDCDRVQDAYCFRCSPQVHGPVIDLLVETRRMLEIEINSATDNPLVFIDGESIDIVSGGNFHGQNIAMASDSIAVACHEIASMAERRINQILDPQWSGQKAFLAHSEGLESGYMIIQYVAAALIAELHLLANSATTSNVPVSMGKEDHASMGATGAFRAMQSTVLLSQVLANEMVCSAEAIGRIDEDAGSGVIKIVDWVRQYVEPFQGDKSMTAECESLSRHLLDGGMSGVFE